jgi:hypothetical protein
MTVHAGGPPPGEDSAQSLVDLRCLRGRPRDDLPMSTTGRRILTAKTMALAIMAIVFAVVAVWHRRRLDAGTAEHRSHSPLVRPSW